MGTSKLKVILCERDISIKELAAAAELNYKTCVAIVNGRRPHLDHAYDISEALGCHINAVFPNLYRYESIKKKYAK